MSKSIVNWQDAQQSFIIEIVFMDDVHLSHISDVLVSLFEKDPAPVHGRTVHVSLVISKFASWYEKLRNAMEYREDEVILRAAIERILKRRLLLGGNAKTTAEPLVRELTWAGYLPNGSITEAAVALVEQSIELHLELRLKVLHLYKLSDSTVNEWTYQLMSSDIQAILNPKIEKETMGNYMFQVLKKYVTVSDDSEETKNAQVFIAVRKAYARDDIALLRYHLFTQYFGPLSKENFDTIVNDFLVGYKEIVKQLNYPLKEKIYNYVKKKSAAFLILEDVLRSQDGHIRELLKNEEEFSKVVMDACNVRYKGIRSKVQRAIIRSVIFLLCTKIIIAFAIEGTYERILFGRVLWNSILLNTGIPPLLMVIVGMFIRTPGVQNSKRILAYIDTLLHDEEPHLGDPLIIMAHEKKNRSFLMTIFSALWFTAFVLSFGAIIYVLTRLQFNLVSQIVFIFFLTIVSFLSYRISLTAHTYTVGNKEGLITPVADFFFMPVVRVGRHLTEGISQINVLLFVFDLFIETPFKGVFAFFEQWFVFLRAKSEEME